MQQSDLRAQLKEFLVELIKVAETRLPVDVYEALKKAYETEENPIAKQHLEAILRNSELAAKLGKPICQDTGTPVFYVEMGAEFPLRAEFYDIAREAVREATKLIPLRPNAVDPFRKKNTGDNTGRFVPWFEVEIVPGDELRVTFVAKGGGSEAPSTLKMGLPIRGVRNVWETVLEAIVEAGPKPCPPVVVGVGVAALSDQAMALAKRAALLRPLGERHPEPDIAELETKLLEAINELGIGAHGFGGKTTALDVHVEYAHRHPATYAVAVATNCWALRRATGYITSSGKWEITSKHITG
ncbi:fumarate hydratase [Pyrofollis japonicus]|uniref:fumarate hydratase n=1 Tax=Pyrofollis japonicus TaxID=3060460 RepID=UPI00295A71C8|nr:fumarate hydratase [Pyrofollis japonicus]BEP18314.1 fumarate hydratase [Pyrofollis japonicus]